MAGYRSVRDLDWPMILLAIAISGFGILQIYSATLDSSWSSAWWKQIGWLGLGLVLMYAATKIDYHTLMAQVPVLYGVCLILLLLTPLVGSVVWGVETLDSCGIRVPFPTV